MSDLLKKLESGNFFSSKYLNAGRVLYYDLNAEDDGVKSFGEKVERRRTTAMTDKVMTAVIGTPTAGMRA